ncbi:hypothetical protein ACOQFO_02110 [Ureibacillus sp. MALMAid1270]|uniref:hypothetical protein n=1 Tax=Ureibacillus sp. MALMAid1270 TaxID=3411629 RepID=UPI003BA6A09D
MTVKSKIINLGNIVTYYHDEIMNMERAKNIVYAERIRKSRLIPLVVEEIAKGKYVLIEKFEYYSSLLKVLPNVPVPCLIYPATTDIERLIHILKISIPLEKGTSWLFKNEHVMKLIQDYNLSDKEIARLTNYNLAVIRRYILDTRIPFHIREKALEMKSKGVLEDIARSTIFPEEVKMILYEKAILRKGNVCRLTRKKFNYMKVFFSICVLPESILKNTTDLENLISWLLFSNFKIEDHMIYLFNSIVKRQPH